METRVAPPILVLGHMRAGTTRVHRLLAADPALASTRLCDSWYPYPERPDLRPWRCRAALAAARRLDPWLETIHPFGATRPDEELGWLAASLSPCAFEVQWRIPSFVAWSEQRDPAPLYREFARLLATDATVRGNANRTRVMKVPQFAEDAAVLLAAFPDARLVRVRRDGEDALNSAVSLIANQMAIQSRSADLHAITEEWRRKMALREQRMDSALENFAGPVAEVDYAALDADWQAAMAAAYRVLGLQFTSAARGAMAAELARSASQSHRHHHRMYAASPQYAAATR